MRDIIEWLQACDQQFPVIDNVYAAAVNEINKLRSDRDALRWLIDNGERAFGSLWREASYGDIDSARKGER